LLVKDQLLRRSSTINLRHLLLFAGALVAAVGLISIASAHDLFAQTPARNPFNVGISEGGGRATGIMGWIMAQQVAFERLLSGSVRAIKTDTSALWTLLGISFTYGVFHAAGPGHGKAVVASYMLANERALRRGIAISFFAAVLQGLVAIAIVGILALILNATSQQMRQTANFVELASYAGIAVLGLWLVWRKGSALFSVLGAKAKPSEPSAVAHMHDHHHHDHAHHHHDHAAHEHAHGHAPHGHPDHVHDEHCGHFHAPDPKTLGDNFSWGGALLTVLAAGSRPCSGAILVLVFALAQGIFTAGIAAAFAMSLGTALTTGALAAIAVLAKNLAMRFANPDSSRTVVLARLFEFGAACLVLLIGITLFFGGALGQG
jgi:ABC-type nickel/cobalt efflux system permease component RcnA